MSMQGNIAVEVELKGLKRKIKRMEDAGVEPHAIVTELKRYIDEVIAAAESGWS